MKTRHKYAPDSPMRFIEHMAAGQMQCPWCHGSDFDTHGFDLVDVRNRRAEWRLSCRGCGEALEVIFIAVAVNYHE